MIRLIALLFASLVALTPCDAYEPHVEFKADSAAEKAATQHAREMVQFAQVELNLTLDWSEGSIASIEEVASELRADLRRERAASNDVEAFVAMLGSYVGEVFRRKHGGEWGFVRVNGKKILAVKAEPNGTLMWPVERIRQRIRGGGSNNVWAYYQARTALASQN